MAEISRGQLITANTSSSGISKESFSKLFLSLLSPLSPVLRRKCQLTAPLGEKWWKMVGKICLDNFPIYHFAPVNRRRTTYWPASSSSSCSLCQTNHKLVVGPGSEERAMWQLYAKPDIGIFIFIMTWSYPVFHIICWVYPKTASLLISETVRHSNWLLIVNILFAPFPSLPCLPLILML